VKCVCTYFFHLNSGSYRSGRCDVLASYFGAHVLSFKFTDRILSRSLGLVPVCQQTIGSIYSSAYQRSILSSEASSDEIFVHLYTIHIHMCTMHAYTLHHSSIFGLRVRVGFTSRSTICHICSISSCIGTTLAG
jgi:hypothetical protein